MTPEQFTGFIRHDGRGYPAPSGTMVAYQRFDGRQGECVLTHLYAPFPDGRNPETELASPWFWAYWPEAGGMGNAIQAYRIIGLPPEELAVPLSTEIPEEVVGVNSYNKDI